MTAEITKSVLLPNTPDFLRCLSSIISLLAAVLDGEGPPWRALDREGPPNALSQSL